MNKVFYGKGSIRTLLVEVGFLVMLFIITAFLAGCGGSYNGSEGWTEETASITFNLVTIDSTN